MNYSGSLEKNKLSSLMREIKDENLTGVLALKSNKGFGTIHFDEGTIISADSPTFRERLGQRLVQNGSISEADLRKCLMIQKTEEEGKRIGDIMVKHGLITIVILQENLKKIMKEVISTMIFWDGIYRFEKSEKTKLTTIYSLDVEKFLDELKKSFSEFEEDSFSLEDGSESSSVDVSNIDVKEEIIELIDSATKNITSFLPQELVILVEDEKLMRTLFSDGLINFGYTVESFDNPTDALATIKTLDLSQVSPIIILDLVMAGISSPTEIYGGLELLAELNSNYPSIPVVVMTSLSEHEIRLKTLFMGASYYLQKPDRGYHKTDILKSSLEMFVEELSLCVENLFRNKKVYTEKETLALIKEELISELMDAKLDLGSTEKELERDIHDLAFLKKTATELVKNQSFSFIIDTIFKYLMIDFDRGFVSVLKTSGFKYYLGFTKNDDNNINSMNKSDEAFSIDSLKLKLFKKAFDSNRGIISEKISNEDAECIQQFLGGYLPSTATIIPFRIHNKTVAVLYCDNSPEKKVKINVDQFLILLSLASLSMQITILNEKIGRKI